MMLWQSEQRYSSALLLTAPSVGRASIAAILALFLSLYSVTAIHLIVVIYHNYTGPDCQLGASYLIALSSSMYPHGDRPPLHMLKWIPHPDPHSFYCIMASWGSWGQDRGQDQGAKDCEPIPLAPARTLQTGTNGY